jgi:type I restriction enzyme M protein
MDASQYKDYVLTLLFVKYVSDKYAGDPYALIQVPDGGSFDDMVALKGSKEIGDLSDNRVTGDDLLGDAYEYLMRHFATESGKSKGQFYTPAEVSRVLAKVVGLPEDAPASQTVYDPTCGSGSLLLKVADEAEGDLSLYGQEMDNATAALAKMNMILHDNPTAEIWQDNTLASPHWTEDDGRLKRFDFAVANPPRTSRGATG